MQDFNSFKGSKPQKNGDAMKTIMNFAKKYEGKSEAELISAILNEAEKGKKNGTLTNADIDNFASMIAPMLSGFQKQKLNEVISAIKNK